MPKPFLLKNSSDNKPVGEGDKGVYTFLKGISQKVNVVACL